MLLVPINVMDYTMPMPRPVIQERRYGPQQSTRDTDTYVTVYTLAAESATGSVILCHPTHNVVCSFWTWKILCNEGKIDNVLFRFIYPYILSPIHYYHSYYPFNRPEALEEDITD